MVHLDQEDQMHCLKTLKLISFYGQRGSKIAKYFSNLSWLTNDSLWYFVLTKKNSYSKKSSLIIFIKERKRSLYQSMQKTKKKLKDRVIWTVE